MSYETNQLSVLEGFYERELISDMLYVVKSGKEATVYCCRAHPSTGREFLAAKVYRPRQMRSFRNDAVYQQGRVILDARLRRAVKNKSRTGRGLQFGSWIENEFETLRMLWEAGADVPEPFAEAEFGPAFLMEYVGDGDAPAPMLRNVSLPPEEVRSVFDVLMRNVELWLACDIVHADLSAYNILYWKRTVKVIDFPQAVDPRFNTSAFSLLLRDIDNLCRYFVQYGMEVHSSRLAGELWTRFLRMEL